MKVKQAFRVPRNERVNKKGHAVSVVFSGPFEPEVDRNTFGLVGVELESSKEFVGLPQSRSAAYTLIHMITVYLMIS